MFKILDSICFSESTINFIEWINNYHSQVNKIISPFLEGKALDWLIKSTQAI